MITIREGAEEDAAAMIELRKQLFRETNYMLLEPEEYNSTVDSEGQFLRSFSNSPNSLVLVAETDQGKLIGFMGVAGGTTNRIRHKATIFMGVLEECWGRGIGTELFARMLEWAKVNGIVRLELTTATGNERAFALYKKMGFEVECIKKQHILLDNGPIDEYQMCLLLPISV